LFLLREPPDYRIERYLASQAKLPFSYGEVGATREGRPPEGYVVDRYRQRLGEGEEAYRRAVEALRSWGQFDLGWVRAYPPDAPLEVGSTVGVVARHLGLWSVNPARIVHTVEETAGPVERFGFAYGTLPGHAARGEERFLVEWDRQVDAAFYDVLAFSRPGHPLARLGRPFVRLLQRRFARDSRAAMVRATRPVV
jgi:uncharacterized protein (UPF0548 family)